MSNNQNRGRRQAPAANDAQPANASAAPYNKGSLNKMGVAELQALIAKMEDQDNKLKRNLTNAKATNTKFTQRITELSKGNQSDKGKRQKGNVTIQAPNDRKGAAAAGERAKSTQDRKRGQNTTGETSADGTKGLVYVRKDRNDEANTSKPKEKPPLAPEIFTQKVEGSEEITKMRTTIKRSWNYLGQLERALTEAKTMELTDEQSIAEELTLIETQVTALQQKRDERRQTLITTKYSMTAENLSMGEFVLTRILNNDPEIRKIWLLGKFKRDPTDNQVVMILNKTEFSEDTMKEIFADGPAQPNKRGK